MTEEKIVDVLFIVPGAKWDLWHRAIKHTMWTFEIEKTIDVMSADEFVRLYKDMSVEEMDTSLKLRCKAMTNTADISKREWKVFQPLRQALYDYWDEKKKLSEEELAKRDRK